MSIYYEHHLEEDLEELRTRWRIIPAPPPPQHLAPRMKQLAEVQARGAEPAAAAAAAGAAAGGGKEKQKGKTQEPQEEH
jgi:hypothetical protein